MAHSPDLKGMDMKSRLIAAALLAATATPAAAEFSDQSKLFLQATIAANGFNCPVVKTISGEGADAYGDVFKVRCGVPGQVEL
jgi:hypothetical protein